MKIVKKSEKMRQKEKLEAKKWSVEVMCKGDHLLKQEGCNSIIKVVEDDLKIFYWHGTHVPHRYLSARCPVCSMILHELRKQVPGYVAKRWSQQHPNEIAEFDGFSEEIT